MPARSSRVPIRTLTNRSASPSLGASARAARRQARSTRFCMFREDADANSSSGVRTWARGGNRARASYPMTLPSCSRMIGCTAAAIDSSRSRESRMRRRRALGRAGVSVGNRSTSGLRSGPHAAASIAAAASRVGTISAAQAGPQALSTAEIWSRLITGTEITGPSSPGPGRNWVMSEAEVRLRSVSTAPAGPK